MISGIEGLEFLLSDLDITTETPSAHINGALHRFELRPLHLYAASVPLGSEAFRL